MEANIEIPPQPERELTPEERYELVKKEGVCPDCGSDVKKARMVDIPQAEPTGASDPPWQPEDIGYVCTGVDAVRGPCLYYINAGETE